MVISFSSKCALLSIPRCRFVFGSHVFSTSHPHNLIFSYITDFTLVPSSHQTNLSLYTITALLILDSDGNRVLAKYYNPPHQTTPGTGLPAELGVGPGGPGMGGLTTLKEQKAFEKGVWEKVRRGGGASSTLLIFQSS
jgi:hypothetical protein